MPPKRIMFIRHAEKPGVGNSDGGVAADGTADAESLTVSGWQRAGALIAFFCAAPEIRPNAIFASGIGHDSKSKRSIETVTPLVAAVRNIQPVAFNRNHLKDDLWPLIHDVLTQEGTILVCWEHKRIPDLAALLPGAPLYRRTGRTTVSTWSGYSTAPRWAGPFPRCRSACFRKTTPKRLCSRQIQ
jgi:hypothetical protein